jgi:hypothetical protein
MAVPRYPALYQVNTRVLLTDLGRALGRPATLDDVPDGELDRLAALGFDWIYLLSVWRTGLAGQLASRAGPAWRREFQETLPDLREEDIGGSGFAITGYTVSAALGGDAALARLRERLRRRGLRLLLDFVPNHTALDHPWVEAHPEYYVAGTELDLTRSPENYVRARRQGGDLVLAHGRDPYFPGWPDTLQLDYSSPALQEAMIGELLRIGGQCDGVRCDMAMLPLPEIFTRTWNRRPVPAFWPEATRRVRARVPGFCFVAEVYWDLEWTLLQQGFDFAYDKRLYDRLRAGGAGPVRDHLRADLGFQGRMARFLENHDEPRAAATFPLDARAAAAVTFLSPGLRFLHQGQLEGRRRRISPHLVRGPDEPVDEAVRAFYARLLAVLRSPVVRDGRWQLLECVPAWGGNPSHEAFVASLWQDDAGARVLVAVNLAPHRSQCFVRLPLADLAGAAWRLADLLGDARHERPGDDLLARGLYLDTPPWDAAAFALTRTG